MTTDTALKSRGLPPPPEPFPLNTPILGTAPLRTFGEYLTWAHSEVLDSQRRGFVAEFMVMEALGENLVYHSGDMYDLRYRGGVQVKASSAIQLWPGELVHRIGFSTRARQAYAVDEEGRGTMLEPQRHGACWVLAVHQPSSSRPEVARRDVLDATKWHYWVVDPRSIRYDHRSAGAKSPTSMPGYVQLLSVIANTAPGVSRDGLKAAVDRVMDAYPKQVPEGWKWTVQIGHWIEEERMHLVPEGAIQAAVATISALRAAYPDHLTITFSPGLARVRRPDDRGVAISLRSRVELDRGQAQILKWLREPKRTWGDAATHAWSALPEAAVAALD